MTYIARRIGRDRHDARHDATVERRDVVEARGTGYQRAVTADTVLLQDRGDAASTTFQLGESQRLFSRDFAGAMAEEDEDSVSAALGSSPPQDVQQRRILAVHHRARSVGFQTIRRHAQYGCGRVVLLGESTAWLAYLANEFTHHSTPARRSVHEAPFKATSPLCVAVHPPFAPHPAA